MPCIVSALTIKVILLQVVKSSCFIAQYLGSRLICLMSISLFIMSSTYPLEFSMPLVHDFPCLLCKRWSFSISIPMSLPISSTSIFISLICSFSWSIYHKIETDLYFISPFFLNLCLAIVSCYLWIIALPLTSMILFSLHWLSFGSIEK